MVSNLETFSGTKDYEFIGFSFNGHHCSEYGLTVVSEGFTQQSLFADFEDKTLSVSGKDGDYYFGTRIAPRTINLILGFDNMTSSNKRSILNWLSPKTIAKFYLDEAPYKYYWIKVASSPSFSFVPFENTVTVGGNTIKTHIYKGTINLQLTATNPYAHSEYFTLDEVPIWNGSHFVNSVYNAANVPGWYGESGLFYNAAAAIAYNNAVQTNKNGFNLPVGTNGSIGNNFYHGGNFEVPIAFNISTLSFDKGDVWEFKNLTTDESFQLKSLKYISDLSTDTGYWKVSYDPTRGTIFGSTSTDNFTNNYNLGSLHNGAFIKAASGNNALFLNREITNAGSNVSFKYRYW